MPGCQFGMGPHKQPRWEEPLLSLSPADLTTHFRFPHTLMPCSLHPPHAPNNSGALSFLPVPKPLAVL